MTTELMLLSFDYQTKWNSWLGSFVIEWQEAKHQFIYKQHPWDLKFYYFSIVCMLCYQNLGAILLEVIIRHFQPHPEFTTAHYIYFALIWIGGCGGVGVAIGLIVLGKAPVMCINANFMQLQALRGGKRRFKPEGKKYPWGMKGWIEQAKDICKTEDGLWDYLGIGLVYFMSYSLWFPLFCGLIGASLDMNPLKWAVTDILGRKYMSNFRVRLVAWIYYFVLITVDAAQVIRLIQVSIILFICPMQFTLKILNIQNKTFGEAKSQKDFDRHILEYMKCQIINNCVIPIVEMDSFVALQVVQWVTVFCCFLTIKLNKYLPAAIWVASGLAAFVFILLISIILPKINSLYDTSNDSIHNWKSMTNPQNKYLRTKYKALQPLRLYTGLLGVRFYMFERSTTTEYYTGITDQIISLMIAYPEKTLDAMFLKF